MVLWVQLLDAHQVWRGERPSAVYSALFSWWEELCWQLMGKQWGCFGRSQVGGLFSQEISYGVVNGSERWLPQLYVRLVLAGSSDVLDRLESAITSDSLQSISGELDAFFIWTVAKEICLAKEMLLEVVFSLAVRSRVGVSVACRDCLFLLEITLFWNLNLFLELC